MSVTWETPAWAQHEPEQRRSRLSGLGGPALGAVAGAAAVAALVFMFYEPAPRAAVPGPLAPAETPAEPAARQIPLPDAAPVLPATDIAAVASPAALPAGSARFTVARPASANADSPVPFAAAHAAPAVDASQTTASLVPVAETESQVVKLESAFAAEGDADFAVPAAGEASAAPDAAAVAIAEPGMSPARTAKWVNLRTAPGNDSEVVAVVPYDAEIMAEENCPHWCSVVYQGKQGYIYKSFVTRRDGA